MQIIVNGVSVVVDEGSSVLSVLARLGQSVDTVAVECNGAIVEPADFGSLILDSGDRIEVVHFVGGG